MNSFSLGINGSWLFVIIIIFTGIFLSLLTYNKTIPPLPLSRKIWLIILRSLGITLLLFALFEPIMTMVRGDPEPPKLAVLLDNSVSAGANDAGGNRKILYKAALNTSGALSLGAEKLKISLFDYGVKQIENFNFDSVKFNGQLTDISRAIRLNSDNSADENIKALLLVTDGVYNSGNNPLYDAVKTGKPVFVIGIGDTTNPKDISVQSLLTNDIAYLDIPIPVNVTIKARGFGNSELNVSLFDNDVQITSKKIIISDEQDSYPVTYEYKPLKDGIHKLTITAEQKSGEITFKNNTLSEFVNVLKNKRKIALFSGSPNSDIPFIKKAITGEKGLEVIDYVQKKGAEFYNFPNGNDIREAEIFVLIDFPNSFTPPGVLQMIAKELEHGKPVLFITGHNVDYKKLRQLEQYLPFNTISSKQQEFLVTPDIKHEAQSSSLLRITGESGEATIWNNLPPIFMTETFVRPKPESEVISTIKVNNTPLSEPLIISRDFQNQKSIAFLGYGVFRWKLLGYASDISKGKTDSPDLFDIFFKNCFKWLSVSEESKLVRIKTSKKFYNNSELVELFGQIYDASYNPVDNSNLLVSVNGGGQKREVILSSLGNGRYYGKLDGLSDGEYSFHGEAKISDSKLGSDEGRFSVGGISIEYQELTMNVKLLRTIAERTGGKFFMPDEAGKFLNELHKHSFEQRGVTLKSEIALWNLPWLLAIALFCFSIEWFLRKQSGLL